MSPEQRAQIQRRLASVAKDEPKAPTVVANTETVVANSRHGKYADPDKRKAYMRELMRKKRAKP